MKLTEEQDEMLKYLFYTDENAWREMSTTLDLVAKKGIKPENPIPGSMYMDDNYCIHIFINNDWLSANG